MTFAAEIFDVVVGEVGDRIVLLALQSGHDGGPELLGVQSIGHAVVVPVLFEASSMPVGPHAQVSRAPRISA